MSHLICCDWGTSNFRVYLIDRIHGNILAKRSQENGVARIDRFCQEYPSTNRIGMFQMALQKVIQEIEQEIQKDLSQTTITISGMASSSIGIMEVPYTLTPFDLNQDQLQYQLIPSSANFAHPILLFGGLQSKTDVMRGEETQLIGLQLEWKDKDCTVLLPGTHSKHIQIKDGRLLQFKTYLTGELFQLIATQSILQQSIAKGAFTKEVEESFLQGVEKGIEGNLLNLLFTIRTRDLLQQIPAIQNYYYLSGLLIGTELKSIPSPSDHLFLSGSKTLIPLYEQAIKAVYPNHHLTILTETQLEEAILRAYLHLIKKINI